LSIVYALNLVSRWVLFGVALHKAYRERNRGWIYIAVSFFLAAMDPERFLLAPLGFHLNPGVAFALDMVNTLFQGVLMIIAAEYIKEEPSMAKMTFPLAIGVLGYFWIIVTNVGELSLGFTTKTLLPVIVYAAGYLYLGIIILKYSLTKGFIPKLFPIGMILLGMLNATYPYTATLKWFLPWGFTLGTVFRVMMAIGALGVVLWPRIQLPPVRKAVAESGTVVYTDHEAAKDMLKSLGEEGIVAITRSELNFLKSVLSPNSMVFWITRVQEGEIEKSPLVYAISPTKLGILLDLISKALSSGYRTVYLDAFEYLILENGFTSALKFLLDLKDRVLIHGGKLVLTLDPNTLDENQLKILEREFGEFKGPASQGSA